MNSRKTIFDTKKAVYDNNIYKSGLKYALIFVRDNKDDLLGKSFLRPG